MSLNRSTRILRLARLMLVVAVGLVARLDAQESPYRGMTDRTVKALSAERTEGLLRGDGLGYALAAELNGYPGPKHVLALRDSLDLTDEQLGVIEETFRVMQQSAQALGRQIVERETVIDSLFAGGAIDEGALDRELTVIAELEGRLRFTHLRAHLTVRNILTPHQRRTYDRLRGYASSHEHEMNHQSG